MGWIRSHPIATVIIVAVIIVLAGAATRFVVVPRYRPALAESERYGIDVSHHQGRIDWSRVAADDIAFAYIKVTEGGDFTDERFEDNWAGAGSVGLDRGAYHFFTFCRPGEEQAAHFLANLPPDAELPPAVDVEFGNNCSERPTRDVLVAELRTFLDRVEAEVGQPVLVYLGPDLEDRYGLTAGFLNPLWVPRFPLRPEGSWTVWQVHGFALVDGIDGPVDLNIGSVP